MQLFQNIFPVNLYIFISNKMKNKILASLALSSFILAPNGWCHSTSDIAVPEIGYRFYVSPDGSDKNPGTEDAPWKTLAQARNHVRSINKEMPGDIEVILGDGVYPLSAPLALTAGDSGFNGFNIIYRSAEGASPVISGGIEVTGWRDDDGDGIWQAAVPDGAISRQLYINGRRGVRARSVDGAGWTRNEPATFQGNRRSALNSYRILGEYASFRKPEELEVVSVMRWKMYRGSVDHIDSTTDGTTAYMNDTFWSLA